MNREQQPWEKRLPDTSQNITHTCSHPNIYMWDCRDEDGAEEDEEEEEQHSGMCPNLVMFSDKYIS